MSYRKKAGQFPVALFTLDSMKGYFSFKEGPGRERGNQYRLSFLKTRREIPFHSPHRI